MMISQGTSPLVFREVINAITHGIGVVFFGVGFFVLLMVSVKTNNPWAIIGVAVYGSALVLMYLASTLFHGLSFTKARGVFRMLDHSAIFLLIAGTYTPFALTVLRGPVGWALLSFVWVGAVCGIVFKVFALDRNFISTILYLMLGWAGLFVAKPLLDTLPLSAVLLLVAGGLSYTAGAVLYSLRQWSLSHGVGHLSMLLGSGFHLAALFLLVLMK